LGVARCYLGGDRFALARQPILMMQLFADDLERLIENVVRV
jgi:hypothetical protein